jgi:lysozyme
MATAMQVSQGFVDHICSLEGLRTSAYTDSSGVRTIGCGHTGRGTKSSTITKDQAYELVRADVLRFEACVNRNVTVDITQGMFDALVSLAYNMGCQGMLNTGVVGLVNQRKYTQAANTIRTSGLKDRRGVVLRGLVTRRGIEADMFMRDGIAGGFGNPLDALAPKNPIEVYKGRQSSTGIWITATTIAALTGLIIYKRRSKK